MSEAAATPPQVPAGGHDPNVHIPRSVRRQAAQSSQLQDMITKAGDPPTTQNPPPSELTMDSGAPAAQPVIPPVTSPVTPPVTPPVTHQPTVEEVQRNYKAMEGRYRKANESLESANQRITELENMVQQMRAAPPAAPTSVESLLTPEEIQDYGPEFIDLVKRASADATRPLLAEIGRLQAQLSHVGQKVEGQRIESMHDKMDAMFPRWRELNSDPQFIEWSNLHDTYSGAIRKKLMQEAWDSGDARRCTAFFQGFLAEEAAITDPTRVQHPSSGLQPAPLAPVAPQGRITLESLAAPGRARSAAGDPPAEKPFYTPQQVSQFYVDVARGRYRGREAEKAQIEADIHMAQFEGRILDTRRPFPRDQFQK